MSGLLAACLLVSMLPRYAWATEPEPTEPPESVAPTAPAPTAPPETEPPESPEPAEPPETEPIGSGTPDGTPPAVTNLEITSPTTITTPGTIELAAEATDDVSGVQGVSVSFKGQNHGRMLHGSQFVVANADADVTTSVSKDTFVDEIANADSDAYIAADYSGDATMPKEAFDAIKGTDKTIDLISEGITWRFEGSDITEEIKDIDLKVDIQTVEEDSSASGDAIEDNLKGNPGVVMKFPENGTLPGKATIQAKVDYAMREYLGSSEGLSVYYYNNQTGELELIASGLKVINDTYVEFPITHCSYYVLTNPNGSNSGSTFPSIAVDKTNFPDENFRAWILEQDYGKDGVLTQDELSAVTMMEVMNQEILDLTGIEHFTALTSLCCVDNQISALDISKNMALTYLDCGANLLTSLDVSNHTGLEYLMCYSNQITALDL